MTNCKSLYIQRVALYPSLFFIQQLSTNHTTLCKCPRFPVQTNNFERYYQPHKCWPLVPHPTLTAGHVAAVMWRGEFVNWGVTWRSRNDWLQSSRTCTESCLLMSWHFQLDSYKIHVISDQTRPPHCNYYVKRGKKKKAKDVNFCKITEKLLHNTSTPIL